ncbi:WD repeat-containing protein 87-like [Liolophura sinensis]|uniref:WD repeat-containing protein 87-like n=1 Tax=Liolophura sinensis TaxID=3198878 RepID=UPI0031591372
MILKEISSRKKVNQALWDKLKPWRSVKESIERVLMDAKGSDNSITLEHGLQLMETLRHCSRIRAMTHFTSSTAEVFLTHYKQGSVKTNCAWEVVMQVSGEVQFTAKKFETQRIISQMIFIPTHYVYVAFCSDLKLVVFRDYKSNCEERCATTCITTLLCMVYNKDTDELITGGVGELLRWTLTGIERGNPPLPGRRFETSIRREDWVRDLKIDRKNKRILALCGFNICVVNYETDKQTHFIESRHIGPLCCCTFYKIREYFITAGMDGCIKVWNAGAMKQVHEFVGHYGKVTSLQISRTDPLLLSSSMDGTVQVWRIDNFQWIKRLDVGEKIYSMKLLGQGNLYCQTVNDVLLYTMNQFYNTFSTVESTVSCLKRVSWPGYMSCIIASTEDGSVRFLSPVTGCTITIIFPLPTFQVFNHFSYNRKKNILLTLTPTGAGE